jgi:hypothetical protein
LERFSRWWQAESLFETQAGSLPPPGFLSRTA